MASMIAIAASSTRSGVRAARLASVIQVRPVSRAARAAQIVGARVASDRAIGIVAAGRRRLRVVVARISGFASRRRPGGGALRRMHRLLPFRQAHSGGAGRGGCPVASFGGLPRADAGQPERLALRHDASGRCSQLTDGGCSVYEHRPRACRTYDCRISAAGVVPDAPLSLTWWRFGGSTTALRKRASSMLQCAWPRWRSDSPADCPRPPAAPNMPWPRSSLLTISSSKRGEFCFEHRFELARLRVDAGHADTASGPGSAAFTREGPLGVGHRRRARHGDRRRSYLKTLAHGGGRTGGPPESFDQGRGVAADRQLKNATGR